MLHIANSLGQIQFAQLMEVYLQGNQEKDGGLLQAEQDFYQYLREDFFCVGQAYYAIWVVNGQYVSALRIEPYRDGVLLEALETAPHCRRRGYARSLMHEVLKREQKVYSHVAKDNTASLRVHEQCGFRRISEQAVYIDGSVNSRCCTLCYENDVSE